MDNRITGAVEVLLEQLAEQERRVAETKRTINALKRSMGEEPLFKETEGEQVQSLKIRRDEYYGKPFATAAQMYLQRRKEACGPDEILKGLEQGGFDFRAAGWRESDRLRSLSISLSKNNKVFHKLPNGTFGLPDWYENIKREEEDSA
jgi:hypothetical protein